MPKALQLFFYGFSPLGIYVSRKGLLLSSEKEVAQSFELPLGEVRYLEPSLFRRSADAHPGASPPGQPVLQILQVRVVSRWFARGGFSLPLLAQPLHLAYREPLVQQGLENRQETPGRRGQKRACMPRREPAVDNCLLHGGGELEQPDRVCHCHAVLPHAPRDLLVGERELDGEPMVRLRELDEVG